MTTTMNTSPLSQFTFPKTGKRGVPQQFPRRLYEMLDGETKLMEASPSHPKVIGWSDSGRAFRIYNASEFADSVLPKYFRTKKFSSFQRNLNLYGFTKVRRGPDSDMYAHPSFLRDQPKSLLQLRKITSSSRTRLVSDASNLTLTLSTTRAVSPSLYGSPPVSPTSERDIGSKFDAIPSPFSFKNYALAPRTVRKGDSHSSMGTCDRGKLDLLALAMEHEFSKCI